MSITPFTEVQRKTLAVTAAAPDGQITCSDLRSLYVSPGDGLRNSTLIRHGLLEWVRRSPVGAAVAIRITDAGRKALAESQ